MSAVTVLDLGMGNLRSVARALERAGANVSIKNTLESVRDAERLVVPGQGHFRDGARALHNGFGDQLRMYAARERPYLGLCLGMQLLLDASEEAPGERGLGLLSGSVVRFTGDGLKVPHMGWNSVQPKRDWIAPEYFFFVHSYWCDVADAAEVAGTSHYGRDIVAAVEKGNIWGTQFHPEKSGAAGNELLRNWLAL